MSQRSINQLFINRPRYKHVFATLSLTAAVAFASSSAVAQQTEHAHQTDHTAAHGQDVAATNAAAQGKAAIDSTTAVVSAHKEWAQARGASNKAAALENLIAKAQARNEILAELIQTNPAEVLSVAIADEKQAAMPQVILDMLEQRVEVEGELEVVIEDYEDGSSKQRQILKTPFGNRFDLHVSGKAQAALTGQQVRVNGLLLGSTDDSEGDIAVNSEQLLTLAAGGGADGGSNGGTTDPSTYNTLGEQRTAVLLVNFQNNPTDKPWTKTQAHSFVFNNVSNYFNEVSYGQTWLTGDTLGWYTVPLDGGNCPSGITDAADQVAASAGVNINNYDRVIYIVAPSSGCGGNWANVGGAPSRAFITAGLDLQIISHELGHTFGLMHSHGLSCSDGALSGNCSQIEYGDSLDVMGDRPAHMNPFQKELLGWLDYNQSPPITEVTTSGSYTIAPTETNDNNAKGLRVLRSVDPVTGQKSWYYIDYRQPIGYDQFLFDAGDIRNDPESLANGVLIHLAKEGDRNSSQLLDMTPGSTTWGPEFDLMDPALVQGATFVDSEAGLTITTSWTDSNGATIDIDYGSGTGGGGTSNSAPIAVNDSASTAHNTAVSIAVLSNDSDPDGDTLNITGTNGVNGSAKISGGNIVFTPNTGFSGIETFSYSISDGKGNSASANVSVAVAAAPDTNAAPTAVNDSASTAHDTSVSIAVLNNDSDPDGDTLTITGTSGVNGSAKISGGNIIFTPNTGFSGTETFSYSISDGKGNSASASVSVTVAAPTSTNQAPVAVNDSATLSSVTAITIPVLNNDWDPENDTLRVVSTTGGNKGSISVNADGSITYSPGKRFKNSDSFSYTITDGEKSANATVTIQLQSSGGDSGNKGGKGNGKKP